MTGTTLMLNSRVSSHNKLKSEVVSSDREFFGIPRGHFLNGVNNGLYLTLDSEAFESSYDDEFSLSTGFLMTLTYPFTRPIVKQKGRWLQFRSQQILVQTFEQLYYPNFQGFLSLLDMKLCVHLGLFHITIVAFDAIKLRNPLYATLQGGCCTPLAEKIRKIVFESLPIGAW